MIRIAHYLLRTLFLTGLFTSMLCGNAVAAQFIVDDGQPRAEIVIAENPARAVDLAARELQTYVEKMSGAKLEIVNEPSGEVPVKIYVGRSDYTQGIEAPRTDDGAFRIVSGPDWLALIGYDWDFRPVGPWARNHGDWQENKLKLWRQMTSSLWYDPIAKRIYRDYNGHAGSFKAGQPRDTARGKTGLWEYDKRGSQNAVYQFLRDLGVRWYMPGELGEVVPHRGTIPLPAVDKTERPDFRWRYANFARYGRDDQESILWSMRLGSNNHYGELLSHGMRDVTDPPEMKDSHPEYYALYAGKRNTVKRKANQCLRSPGLFEETVRFCRALYDIHDVKMVSVMPSDGYSSVCQCELCKDQATLERGRDGWISDYVWEWTNRVAKELYKTHPDRYVSNFAYGTYKLPPLKIDKLSPNVVVGIVHGRQSRGMDPETGRELDELRRKWLAKSSNKLVIWINYPQMRRGAYRPCYWPRITARSIRATKGQSQGEFSWLPEDRGLDVPGVNHLTAYMYLRYLWDADQDIDAVLDEYYQKFYGPAGSRMKAFIEYCETHYEELADSKDVAQQAMHLFSQAQAQVDNDSVHGQRIALVDVYLDGMRNRLEQLEKERGPVPTVQMVDRDRGRWLKARDSFTLDGHLDEPFWHGMPHACGGKLRDTETGREPRFPATFKVVWANGAVHFGIRCQDLAGNPVNVATEKDGDPAIFHGDAMEILIETDSHSYYQIVINPAGTVVDLDRKSPKNQWYEWSAQAEVATHIGEDYWTVEVKLPVDQNSDDPNHLIAGRKPTEKLPWYINVCRQRMRNNDAHRSCWSPTGTDTFHDVMKFGKLHIR